MLNRFERKSHKSARADAQENLGRITHYVDSDVLRFHRSRILHTVVHPTGLLYGLVESYAADPYGHRRLYRGVIFDAFGNVVYRPDLDDGFAKKKPALEALKSAMSAADPFRITSAAISDERRRAIRHARLCREELARIKEEYSK